MKIDHEIFSHVRTVELDHPARRGTPSERISERSEWTTVTQVRRSLGYRVKTFETLVSLVAEVGYRNRRYNLLFRGQEVDHKDRNGASRIYPSIYRPKDGQTSLRGPTLAARFEEFRAAMSKLRNARSSLADAGPGLYRHWEYQAALLQHYKIRKTPLLDATQSLRVAASFAMPRASHGEGFIMVLGMPHPHGSISHFVDDDMTLVKLQNVCPPEALRPHYQEGYLLGRMSVMNRTKEAADNAAYRLLAKYHLTNDGGFWTKSFRPIHQSALLPRNDPFLDKILRIVGPDPVP